MEDAVREIRKRVASVLYQAGLKIEDFYVCLSGQNDLHTGRGFIHKIDKILKTKTW